mgnify:CR=1 FL=1|jgi:hypothetical protein
MAVDKDKTETVFDFCPRRAEAMWVDGGHYVILPTGSIQKLIGRKLTWSDEPVELK